MNQILLFLHLIGLVLAWGPGLASGIAMQAAGSAPPEEAAGIRRLPVIFSRVTGVGLLLLWITGPIMAFTVYGGMGNLPWQFWVKFVFVVILSVLFGLTQMRMRELKAGNMAAAAQLPILGGAMGVSALFAVLFAVLAFDTH